MMATNRFGGAFFAVSLLRRSRERALARTAVSWKQKLWPNAAKMVTPPPTRLLSSAVADKPPSSANKKNIFLDNLGTIFLSTIGLIIASLVRSYYGTANRNKVRDRLEEQASVDPVEIDDLRVANSELTPAVFRAILTDVSTQENMTYDEFVTSVRSTMHRLKGPSFTVQLGYLLDRVVLGALQRRGKSSQDSMPTTFWFAILSLALHSSVQERIQVLYEVLQQQQQHQRDDDVAVTLHQVQEMVGFLQDSCQLVPDSQIVPIASQKYPVQQFACATPQQLVVCHAGQRRQQPYHQRRMLLVLLLLLRDWMSMRLPPFCAASRCVPGANAIINQNGRHRRRPSLITRTLVAK